MKKHKGFTLIEILIVIAIIIILVGISFPFLRGFQKESDLVNSSEKIVSSLRLAQNKTLASKQSGQWGVFFATSTEPNEVVLFRGEDYQSRDIDFDVVYQLADSVEIYEINLNEQGIEEVVFYPIIGTTDQFGSISIRIKDDHEKTNTIYIQPLGYVGLVDFLTPLDEERIKDSRRVFVNYSRSIDISDESLILTFEGDITEEIIIDENMRNNQVEWQGGVVVDGEEQIIKIQTYRLNDPDTLFFIERDMRFNNKELKIEISGDTSGTLIEYFADGLITTNTSIYATEVQWQ